MVILSRPPFLGMPAATRCPGRCHASSKMPTKACAARRILSQARGASGCTAREAMGHAAGLDRDDRGVVTHEEIGIGESVIAQYIVGGNQHHTGRRQPDSAVAIKWMRGSVVSGPRQGVGAADELGPEPGHFVARQARAIGEGAVALRGQHGRGHWIDQQLRGDDRDASSGIDLAGGHGGEVPSALSPATARKAGSTSALAHRAARAPRQWRHRTARGKRVPARAGSRYWPPRSRCLRPAMAATVW